MSEAENAYESSVSSCIVKIKHLMVVLFFGLLEIIKHFPPSVQRVNFHEDWKVITVLIGGNDLCDYCTDSVMGAGQAYALLLTLACGPWRSSLRTVPRINLRIVQGYLCVCACTHNSHTCTYTHFFPQPLKFLAPSPCPR